MNIPILLYHSISTQKDDVEDQWAVSPENFEIHLSYLREQGYQPLTVNEIATAIRAGSVLPKKPVAITFDDGLEDFLTHAVPILQNYDFSSTLFIATGFVGGASHWTKREGEKTRPMLSWQGLALLQGKVDIGAHSHNHPQMDIIPLVQARKEAAMSKKLLEHHLDAPITTFAYPHGYHSRKVMRVLEEVGYTSACIVGHTMATDKDDVFALPRIIIKSDVTIEKLSQYLQGIGLTERNFWNKTRRKGWRFVRKIKGGYLPGVRALSKRRERRLADRESNQ